MRFPQRGATARRALAQPECAAASKGLPDRDIERHRKPRLAKQRADVTAAFVRVKIFLAELLRTRHAITDVQTQRADGCQIAQARSDREVWDIEAHVSDVARDVAGVGECNQADRTGERKAQLE